MDLQPTNDSPLKYGAISFVVLIAFSVITTTIISSFLGTDNLLTVAAGALPIITLIAATLLIQTTLLLNFLLDLLLLPLRLLGLRRKRQEADKPYEEGDEFVVPKGHAFLAIIVCTFSYAVIGYFLITFRDVDFPLSVFSLMGFGWGCILYYGFRKGVMEGLT